jgi:phage major head subunit gpT-like protein
MYLPSTAVISKILEKAFEIEMKAMLEKSRLTGIESLFMGTYAKTGKGDYAWLGDIPGVREWIGSKVYGDLSKYTYSITNKRWYNGFAVHKDAFRRDELDSVRPRVQMLVAGIESWKAEMIIQFLLNGETELAFDGLPFFANGRANDNLLAGTGIALAQIKTDLVTARKTSMRFVTDQGKYLRIIPDTIICPVELEETFLEIKESAADPGGAHAGVANIQKRYIANVIALPDLTDATDWYYATTGMPLKPFIFQGEKLENGADVLPVTDDGKVASDGVYGFSAEMYGNAGYGFPELCLKVVNA